MIKDSITASKREVRNFGLLFSGIFMLLLIYFLYREGELSEWLLAASGVFLVSGLFLYPFLRPVYILWMKFAQVLAWINTRVILGIAYYLILTPIGLLLRLFGKDLIGLKIDRNALSYWKKRGEVPFDAQRCERLF